MSKEPKFRMMARTINQLGEQLIKNEATALLELIKNAYDADASKCHVILKNPEHPNRGEIEILDDGEGMDFSTLTGAFLDIGTNYKECLKSDAAKKRTSKYHRLRLGEKGIGRFGIHRLGRQIQIITKRANSSSESVLNIDWDVLENYKYIEDFPISAEKRTPQFFKTGSGTKIVVKGLRNAWNRRIARESKRMITSLNSPFESNDSFKVDFTIPNYDEWFEGLANFEDIVEYRLFSFDLTMEGTEIIEFEYQFLPWSTMTKVKKRIIKLKDIKALTRIVRPEGRNKTVEIDLSNHRIGKVRFQGMIFDRDPTILALGCNDKSGVKKYLDENGGVRVYRNNVRVLNYGEPGNDWLDLGGRRVNIPTKRVSNNLILGAVELENDRSEDLREKANREGFLENDAYYDLFHAIRFALDRIETFRKEDKDRLRDAYSPKQAAEPVVTSIAELKQIVDQYVKDKNVCNKINGYLDRIQSDYENITETLIVSAGAGLNLIVVIHQIEKLVKQIMASLKRKGGNDLVLDQVSDLASIVEGYGILVKSSEKKSRVLADLVEQGISNVRFRFLAHKIELCKGEGFNKRFSAVCSASHILNALMNLFDNSIWWLGYQKNDARKKKRIFVDISDQYPDHISIVVADNGPGFGMSYKEATKPFVTLKPGGMGIGLHLTETIMESLNGILLFPPGTDDFEIPRDFAQGAIVALAFKKGK